jgi:hypothetical protein
VFFFENLWFILADLNREKTFLTIHYSVFEIQERESSTIYGRNAILIRLRKLSYYSRGHNDQAFVAC